jgi:hypothetical protein
MQLTHGESVGKVIEVERYLGMFTKLQKATISFVMSVRPSAHPQGATQLPLHRFS